MTPDERLALNAKIGELLFAVLADVRAKSYPPMPGGSAPLEEINALADLTHHLPRYVVGRDEYAVRSLAGLRAEVAAFVRRFHPGVPPERHRYVAILGAAANP